MYRKTTLAAFLAAALWAGTASAAAPTMITYSGFLTESDGTTAVTVATDLTFRFYAGPSGGAAIASETITVTPASDGFFSAIVGGGIGSFPSLFNSQVYMSVQFVGDAAEMAPRVPITSVPSALSVDWTGITNRPVSSCSGATPYVIGVDVDGNVTCAAAPAGAGACGSGQILRWNGAAWTCVTDQVGTVTGVTALAPLATGGTATAPQVQIPQATSVVNGYLSSTDWNTFNNKQARVSGSCVAGSSIRVINADGTVTCETDDNSITSVSVTAPITNVGTASAPNIAISGAGCANPSILRWNGTSWSCSPFSKTVITYSTGVEDVAPATTGKLLRTIGTFTKASASTSIEIQWHSHVSVAGTVCNFYLRVDGVASPNTDVGGAVASGSGYHPVSTTNIWTGLAAGSHTITVYDRGVAATSCFENPGNFVHEVVVTEF